MQINVFAHPSTERRRRWSLPQCASFISIKKPTRPHVTQQFTLTPFIRLLSSRFFLIKRQSVTEKLIYREQGSNETQKCHLRRAPGIILFYFFIYSLGVMKVSIKTLILWLQHSWSSHRVTLSMKERQVLLEVKGSGLFWSYLQG